ncbi:MAG: prolipoprotein diacylglyceryl transferase [Clostridiales bacterium]|nr:prolipoprotein diacylglyceryl transferase [Clostridiales bacterium]
MQHIIALEKHFVSFPGLGWKFSFNSIAFELWGIQFYWYGILIAAAVALCLILGMKQCRKNGLTPDLVTDYCLLCFPLAFLGARLYYVFCEWKYYHVKGDIVATLKGVFNVRQGGLAIYGGVLGAAFAIFLMSKLRKIPVATVMDFAIVYIPLGQCIGRWGNFFNQEAFGTNTDLPWGMYSTSIGRYLSIHCPELDSNKPVHPTFLYESLGTLIIFILLLVIRKKSKKPWTTTACYCVFYGIVRFLIEGLRTDSLYISGTNLRTSQVLSLVLIVIGLLVISLGRIYDWEKKPVPEKFIKADEQMRRDAARKKEQKYKDFEADEDIEDRVERLSKSSFTVEDEEESDDSDDDASSDEQSDSEADDSSEESSDAESTDGDQEVEK